MRGLRSGFLAALAAIAVWTGDAQGQSGVEIKLSHRIHGPDGVEHTQPQASVRPGDVIAYTFHYRNRTNAPILGVILTLPIPLGMEFVPGSAHPETVTASIDGKRFAEIPLKKTVYARDIVEREELIPYSEYRYLAWFFMELRAGSGGALVAQLRMTTSAELAPIETGTRQEERHP